MWVNPHGTLNYVFCEVSKAGCTTWQHILKTDFTNGRKRSISRISRYDAAHANDSHFRFLNIRHPFERLLSAYRNAVRKRRGDRRGPGWTQLNYVGRMFNTSHDNVTLTQFLQFIASSSQRHPAGVYFDRHWDSFARSCKVCSISYDYILRTETSSLDAGDVLTRVVYPRNFLGNFQPMNSDPTHTLRANKTSSSDAAFSKGMTEFESVSRDLLHRVFDRFRLDFEAFGYNFDFDENVAYCAIRSNDTDVCC